MTNLYCGRLALGGLLGVVLAVLGCSDSGGQSAGAATPDPLADAPAEWDAFLSWAEGKLQGGTSSAPLPESPKLARPEKQILRLADRSMFRRAVKSAEWTAPPDGGDVLAEIGPFRSSQAGPNCSVTRSAKASPDGKQSLSLKLRGFAVLREEIGSIELTAVVPFGKHLVLKWSKAGSILVPVESHDEPFTVRVLADELAEWQGPLNEISIILDGYSAEQPVEIRSVRFLPREASYPAAIGLKRVRLGHEIRSAIYAHCPSTVSFENVLVPADGRFQSGIGFVSGTEAGVELIVDHGGEQTAVLSERISTAGSWSDVSASLSRWSGETVTLMLKVTGTEPETVAIWGNPTVYEPVADPPIVVLYLIDTVAAEHVNLNGYERATMPRLSRMAAGGVRFSRMYSNSSRTVESIPDLMLSMPTERHGVHHNSTPAPQGLVTLAEAVRAGGFATASFCTNVNAGPRQGMDQGFDTFVDKIGYYWTADDRTIPLEEVMAWVAAHRDRPMFLYIHTAEPHAPYAPPEGFAGRFDADYRGRIDGTYNRATTFRLIRNPRAQSRDLQHVKALYDEEILYSDARLGMFLDGLKQAGLLDRSHFFVTSDHGEEFLQHGHWEHGVNLHNEQTRVPLVAWGPSFARGARIDAPVQILDLMPTILEMFDLPAPYELAGRSLLPVLRPEPSEAVLDELKSRGIYASNHNYRISQKLVEYSAIGEGRWKLLYGYRAFPTHPGGPRSRFLLFDVESDPRERRNAIQQNQGVARKLIEDLVRWRLGQHVYDAGADSPTVIDARQMREMAALGYVGNSDDDDSDEPNDPDKLPGQRQP